VATRPLTTDAGESGLKVVDGFDLEPDVRALLKPAQLVEDKQGRRHRLPRYFYEVPSHQAGVEIRLTPHFGLNEFLLVDLKEAARLRQYPRYIPCAVRVLAFYLEQLRMAVGAQVHIAVNGGYRSPSHRLAVGPSPHMWATAADLYRIGATVLRERASIETYNRVAQEISDDLWIMPYGHELGQADDHIHLDLGYLTVVPREIGEDSFEAPQTRPRFAFEERRSGDRRGWPQQPDFTQLTLDTRPKPE
jgi:hypothetical protein